MSVASRKKLLSELKVKKFRDDYAAEHVKTMIPIQTRILREERSLTQGQLARLMKTTQTVISRLEDPNYGKLSLSSLLKVASAFDVALLVKFVPFLRLLREFEDASPQALSALEFIKELPQLEKWAAHDTQTATDGLPTPLRMIPATKGDFVIKAAVGGGKLSNDVPTGRSSSIQEQKRALVAGRVEDGSSATRDRAPLLIIQENTA